MDRAKCDRCGRLLKLDEHFTCATCRELDEMEKEDMLAEIDSADVPY